MNYYNYDNEEVLDLVNTNKGGLTREEVNNRLEKYGFNEIISGKKKSKLRMFLEEFKDLLLIILLISGIFSIIISYLNNESYLDGIIIILIVILNCFVEFIQELKASNAVDELKKIQVTNVLVKRNNRVEEINSKYLVVGDIILLEAGDIVPSDARILESTMLKVNESCLTGESIDISKNNKKIDRELPLASRSNMIYSGTNITYGKCTAVVTETGMNTELGHIAKELNTIEKNKSPLEIKLADISKVLSYIILIIVFLIFTIGLIKGLDLQELLMLSISLAVAAVPEGLPTVITIILSLGVISLSKKKAIIKKIKAVETLGCTEIICTDKTGTITQNKMNVEKVYFNNNLYTNKALIDKKYLEYVILNNDVNICNGEYIGDQTEIAILEYSKNKKINIVKTQNKYPRINEIPFDSSRKMMTTIHTNKEELLIVTKGSFDSVIEKCTYVLIDNEQVKLTKTLKEELHKVECDLSSKAYRVLTVAYKNVEKVKTFNNIENNLIFLMMFAMIDPPRKDVKDAIKSCIKAHIKPIMITGDSLETAQAIGRDIGIMESDEEAILGMDFDKLDKNNINELVKNYSVYARVSPENKLEIVKAWQANNKVVAMAGDGVNDAPAINQADIGVGMGLTGSDVSKDAADMILLDDSFSSIVNAIHEGRIIYDNIKNILLYLLTGNIAEILIVLIGIIFGMEIFIPVQLLYINLVTDSIPAIALAFEKGSSNIMDRKPRKKEESLFTKYFVSKMSLSSILKTLAVLLIYFVNIKIFDLSTATTMAFLTLILLEIVFAYSCRNIREPVLGNKIFANIHLNKSTIFLLIIQTIIMITPLKSIFDIKTLSFIQVMYTIFVVLICYLVDELSKILLTKIFKD